MCGIGHGKCGLFFFVDFRFIKSMLVLIGGNVCEIYGSHLVWAIQIEYTYYNHPRYSILSQKTAQRFFLHRISALTVEIFYLLPNI